jgi:hypothetical protein
MPWYLFKCPVCLNTEDLMLPMEHRDRAIYCDNPDCKRYCGGVNGKLRMERQPTAANFTVTGYAAKNGYAK